MTSTPVPIQLLPPRAAAGSAAHVEGWLFPPTDQRPPEPKFRTLLPFPDPWTVIVDIGKSILKCRTERALQAVITKHLFDFLYAKLRLLGDMLAGPGSLPALREAAQQGIGKTRALVDAVTARTLPPDAKSSARMALHTFDVCNEAYFEAFSRDPKSIVIRRGFEEYVGWVLAIEMVQVSLVLYLSGSVRPATRYFAIELTRIMQSWSAELMHAAKRLGFFDAPQRPSGEVLAPDADTLEWGEESWLEFCRGAR